MPEPDEPVNPAVRAYFTEAVERYQEFHNPLGEQQSQAAQAEDDEDEDEDEVDVGDPVALIRKMVRGLSLPENAAAIGGLVAAITEHIPAPSRATTVPTMPTESGNYVPVSVPINLPARVVREEDGSYSAAVP